MPGPAITYSTVISNFLANWPAWAITGKSDGDRVTALADGNDSSRDMTGSTGAIYRANAFGTRPGLEFDGGDANNCLASAGSLDSGLDSGSFYIVLVLKATPWANRGTLLNGYETVFAKSDLGGIRPIWLGASQFNFGDSDLHVFRVGGSGDPRATDAYDLNPHIVEHLYDSGSGVEKVYIDGLQTYSGTRSATSSGAPYPFSFGKSGSGNLAHCMVAECAIWAASPDDTQRGTVVSAFGTYYGISVGGTPPSAPTGFTAVAAAQKVTIDFTAGANATQHYIYRDATRIAILDMPTVSFIDYTGDVGTAYDYTVVAHNTAGDASTSALNRTATVPIFDPLDVKLIVEGDSISTDALHTIPKFAVFLAAKVPGRTVNYINNAVNGQDTAAAINTLADKVAAARAFGATHVMFFFGANDSKSSENVLKVDFKAHSQTFITAYQKGGIITIINECIYSGLDNGVAITGSDFIPQYRDAQDELAVTNSTWAKIGDTAGYNIFFNDQTLYSDSPPVHPNATTGSDMLGGLWADSAQNVFNSGPTVTGTISSSTQLDLDFSESVTGVVASDFTLSGHTLSAATGSGTSWSMTISPVAGHPETPTLGYTGTSVINGDSVPMDTFSGQSVTNNSELTTPDAPILTGATATALGITMDIEAGASDGGSAIIDYQLWHKRDSAAYVLAKTILAADITSPVLDNTTALGEVVLLKSRARNVWGFGPYSDEIEVESAGPGGPFTSTPSVLERGQTNSLTLTGTDFDLDAAVTVDFTLSAGTVVNYDSVNHVLVIIAATTLTDQTLTHTPSSSVITLTAHDTIAPTRPHVTQTGTTGVLSSFTLTWASVATPGETVKYRVYKNAVELTTAPGQTGLTYAITGAAYGDVFTVTATDNSGNTSTAGRFAIPSDLTSGGGGGFYHRYGGNFNE